MLRGDIAGSHDSLIFNFLRRLHVVAIMSAPVYDSVHRTHRRSASPTVRETQVKPQ